MMTLGYLKSLRFLGSVVFESRLSRHSVFFFFVVSVIAELSVLFMVAVSICVAEHPLCFVVRFLCCHDGLDVLVP